MKKICVFLLCLLIVFPMCIPCSAYTADETVVYTSETDLGNGIMCTETITVSDGFSRIAGTKTGSRTKTYTYYDKLIAEIAITATFTYNGVLAGVTSMSISKCETYDGWKFQQTSFAPSGGTLSLTGKLTKLFFPNVDVNISLTCDKNGNIS